MNVSELIKHLQELVKENSDIGEMHIRVLEDSPFQEDGDAKGNFWIDFKNQILVNPLPSGSLPTDKNYKGEIVFKGEE